MIALVTPLVIAMRMELMRRKKVIVCTVGVILLSIFGEFMNLTLAEHTAFELPMTSYADVWSKILMGISKSFRRCFDDVSETKTPNSLLPFDQATDGICLNFVVVN